MELLTVTQERKIPIRKENSHFSETTVIREKKYTINPFIEANTINVSLFHLKNECVIPVFAKDNEQTISHQEFVDISLSIAKSYYPNEIIENPEIRVSHQVKGRTPEAIHIPAKELLDNQKTIYHERMAFIIRISSVTETINGNELSLCIGGVRSYNHENLYSKKTMEKFKFFIGFQNMVCCNMCISTDGFKSELKATSILELESKIRKIVEGYSCSRHLKRMKDLVSHSLSEKQFAQLIGKSRLYNHLPKAERVQLPELLLNDNHFNTIAKDYFADKSFCKNIDGTINLWHVYNLLTGANKSSYIDTFLDRSVNAFGFAEGVSKAINGDSQYRWFLS
ncbi:DUF3871 family protein [Maribacter stanieri]|uniref:DUF3871 family protein n=1 Tax=Maribacter stanieri TaxID=440514 RepID=UPI002494903E|nr:DUF3871 family protein [Maribacter stanieri]